MTALVFDDPPPKIRSSIVIRADQERALKVWKDHTGETETALLESVFFWIGEQNPQDLREIRSGKARKPMVRRRRDNSPGENVAVDVRTDEDHFLLLDLVSAKAGVSKSRYFKAAFDACLRGQRTKAAKAAAAELAEASRGALRRARAHQARRPRPAHGARQGARAAA